MSEAASGSPGGERWLPVVGYEGMYEVSDQGRVRSFKWRPEGMILRPMRAGFSGHQTVCLRKDGRAYTGYVHRLMMRAFVGPPPEGAPVVRHLDDDVDNNVLENLAYGTHSENHLDRVRNGIHTQTRKTECPRGHELADFNNRVNVPGSRGCKACQRARANLVHSPNCGFTFQELSDAHFARLLAGKGEVRMRVSELMEEYGRQ